jgi:hypothetical protein
MNPNIEQLLDSESYDLSLASLPTCTAEQKLRELSYSSVLTLHACPRKYELSKLAKEAGSNTRSVTFAFGHSMGAGIQEYMLALTQGMQEPAAFDKALLAAFLAYDYDLLDAGWDSEIRAKKSFATSVLALHHFRQLRATGILADYEVATINRVPACELSFRIKLLDDFVYRGFMDMVLRHKHTGELLVLEIKSTGVVANEANYKNSSQALGYAVILDSLGTDQQSFDVLYLVYNTRAQDFQQMLFTKFFHQKVDFINSLVMDCELVTKYEAADYFPKHGESCFSFFRNCEFYDTCGLSNAGVLPPNKRYTADSTEYTIELSLLDIITAMEHGAPN